MTSSPLRVVVTGGAAGIGLAIAKRFAANDDRVHVLDVDGNAISSLNGEVTGTIADVTAPQAVEAGIDAAHAALGGIDVLVNNAGISGLAGPVEDVDVADLRRTLDVNVVGAVLCTARAVPSLVSSGGGSIVNIASTAGILGYPNRTPYAASKWALVGLTKTWTMELGGRGIRVNAVCPGSVEGPRMDGVIVAEAAVTGREPTAVRSAYEAQTSLGTFVREDDITETVAFLCSPGAAKITGQIISVDGHAETLRT